MKKKFRQRALRWAALLLAIALPGVPAHARAHHTESWARDRFASAERMREALNGRPPADRSRRDYQRVINAYRSVYFGAPTSTKADPSAVGVAETLVEMGRRFDDDKILHSAIAQYKFLRKEYPGSKYRCDALFTIGEIYKDDLNDPDQARNVFQEFLRRYPHNRLAEDAQQAMSEMDREAAVAKKAEGRKKLGKQSADANKGRPQNDSAGKEADAEVEAKSDVTTDGKAGSSQEASDTRSGRMPRVTGIRHWSTPDYTRVAIDLESEIKFGSQRISNPDRIFFDLRDTKLASTLVGKSFDVDDGFLKKIRVAQFQPGRTRVVLEVDDLSDYDAFLLPNPYRLIIDIHGKDFHSKNTRDKSGHGTMPADATADVEVPPVASTKLAAKVPKSEVKADMRALAGKPISDSEQIHNSQDIVSRAESSQAVPPPESQRAAGANARTGIVKKVVVDADDDDPTPPVKAANLDAAARRSSRKARSEDSDSPSGENSDEAAAPPVRGKSSQLASKRASGLGTREAKPTASGDRSLIRALGLKIGRIVIDPGHGGHDTGTIGPNGLQEKDLVLEVGRRLGKMLETRLGAEVVYTRKDDTFIPLETRTAVANQQRADLFISIHANSSHDP
ncbi:MAG: hypothetical protein DMG79_05320, partial [Acidobacteria bacterium]